MANFATKGPEYSPRRPQDVALILVSPEAGEGLSFPEFLSAWLKIGVLNVKDGREQPWVWQPAKLPPPPAGPSPPDKGQV